MRLITYSVALLAVLFVSCRTPEGTRGAAELRMPFPGWSSPELNIEAIVVDGGIPGGLEGMRVLSDTNRISEFRTLLSSFSADESVPHGSRMHFVPKDTRGIQLVCPEGRYALRLTCYRGTTPSGDNVALLTLLQSLEAGASTIIGTKLYLLRDPEEQPEPLLVINNLFD